MNEKSNWGIRRLGNTVHTLRRKREDLERSLRKELWHKIDRANVILEFKALHDTRLLLITGFLSYIYGTDLVNYGDIADAVNKAFAALDA